MIDPEECLSKVNTVRLKECLDDAGVDEYHLELDCGHETIWLSWPPCPTVICTECVAAILAQKLGLPDAITPTT